MNRATDIERDRGAILPIVLVVGVVLSLVVVALATYAATTIRHGQQVERSAERLAAADGGVDYVLDTFRQRRTLCATALAETSSGVTETFEGEVNEIKAEVHCRVIGTGVATLDDWAVIMTGESQAPGTALLLTSGGGGSANADKTIGGPVFMEGLDVNLLSDLTIDTGDLWYRDDGCPDISHKWADGDAAAPAVPSRLIFTPESRGLVCTTASWTDLFLPKKPAVSLPSSAPNTPNPELINGCNVWKPGSYSSAPDFSLNDGYNYLRSGPYLFDNVGEIDLRGSYVLAGYPGPAGPSITKLKDASGNGRGSGPNPCRFVWVNDAGGDGLGATIYLDGNSSIFIRETSALEVAGKKQGNVRVGIQALDTSTVTGLGEIVTTKAGNGSQLSVKGLVWAPNATFNFDNIANDTVAALRGGAVVSRLLAGAAAQTENFVIEVATQPSDALIAIESTATNSGATRIRAVVRFRPSDGAYAIESRRVAAITPE